MDDATTTIVVTMVPLTTTTETTGVTKRSSRAGSVARSGNFFGGLTDRFVGQTNSPTFLIDFHNANLHGIPNLDDRANIGHSFLGEFRDVDHAVFAGHEFDNGTNLGTTVTVGHNLHHLAFVFR
jgi:hypothetical protein